MGYYTLCYKIVDCPFWKAKIKITAKYRLTRPEEDPYYAKFSVATCEVLENLKLPESKRDKRLALYRFCRMASTCPCLKDFPEEIDLRKP